MQETYKDIRPTYKIEITIKGGQELDLLLNTLATSDLAGMILETITVKVETI